MSETAQQRVEALRKTAAAAIRAHWKIFFAQGLVMTVLGILAVALPNIATLAIEILIGWLLFIGGLFRVLSVLRARGAPGFWWALLTALLALALGLLLIAKPLEGVLTLTMVLVAVFVAEGIAGILIALDFRRHLSNWGWSLFGGLSNLVLAYLIWQGWPATADWAIGLLVGINMFMLGLSLVMAALAARTLPSS
ncbi:MAG: HdeD family acid-resistance protein [Rhodospirillaceae bacterium]|jgi:uncharacterized membrane protein HdeD (DUF308 family)|nr:HdeD family acid-resistance protein [Rhodospirillaceae bacterium]MBT6117486.1 HdeD family acid-resistance protein [Rhodospirillaceae bacterium]